MSIFDRVTYSRHALRRMQKRHVSPEEVVMALRFGEGHFDEGDGTWPYEFA